jgi:hypothetical protein
MLTPHRNSFTTMLHMVQISKLESSGKQRRSLYGITESRLILLWSIGTVDNVDIWHVSHHRQKLQPRPLSWLKHKLAGALLVNKLHYIPITHSDNLRCNEVTCHTNRDCLWIKEMLE